MVDVIRWRKRMQQNVTDQEKSSADENGFVCNGRFTVCFMLTSRVKFCTKFLAALFSSLNIFTVYEISARHACLFFSFFPI